MPRKSKIDPSLKIELVEQYLRNEIGIREAGRMAGLAGNGSDAFRKWINIYQNDGPSGLLDQEHNKHYPIELKLEAVNSYIQGEGSLSEILGKHCMCVHKCKKTGVFPLIGKFLFRLLRLCPKPHIDRRILLRLRTVTALILHPCSP